MNGIDGQNTIARVAMKPEEYRTVEREEEKREKEENNRASFGMYNGAKGSISIWTSTRTTVLSLLSLLDATRESTTSHR
jgi:hypothetical protein